MKKIVLAVIILITFFVYFEVNSVGNQVVTKGKYIIQKKDTISNELPTRLGLEKQGIFYKIWLKFLAQSLNLQAGTYTISKDSTLEETFSNNLKKPDSLDQEITIIPGWNIFDIDEYLSNKGIIKTGELISLSDNLPQDLVNRFKFLKGHTLEGFLYPDTYRLQFNISVTDLVSVLLSEFNNKIFEKYTGKEFYNTLNLSSIVQREVFEDDKDSIPIVAGILKKRLDEGMSIGADATTCYAYKKTFKECTPSFIAEKIYIKTDYNTRNKIGLPSTPISNMTDEIFDATKNPEDSPYYYYLHDNSKVIHFGKTLNDHNRNKNLYLK